MRIVYVDDSEFDRMAFKRLTRKFDGYEFFIFQSLDELNNNENKGNSLLIRDCYLPGKEPDYSRFKAVYFVSGSKPLPSLKSKLNIGAEQFFLKPLKQEDIASMLKGSEKSADVSLDLSYLDELSDGDETFKKEMINVFLKEVPEQISHLEGSVSERNYDQTATVIHALRTKIRTFGIIAIDELSERLEYTAKTKSFDNWKDFEKEVQNLTSELTKSALKLEQML